MEKNNPIFPQYQVFFSNLVTDLALLSLADHSILTYGTYGMWGALLAKGGETLMSKEFMKTDIGSQIAAANLTNWKTIEQIFKKVIQ